MLPRSSSTLLLSMLLCLSASIFPTVFIASNAFFFFLHHQAGLTTSLWYVVGWSSHSAFVRGRPGFLELSTFVSPSCGSPCAPFCAHLHASVCSLPFPGRVNKKKKPFCTFLPFFFMSAATAYVGRRSLLPVAVVMCSFCLFVDIYKKWQAAGAYMEGTWFLFYATAPQHYSIRCLPLMGVRQVSGSA